MIFTSNSSFFNLDPLNPNYLAISGGTIGIQPVEQVGPQQVVRRAGALQNMFVHFAVVPGVGASWTVTLRVNGANTALTCTVAGAATDASDVVNTVNVVAGDLLTYLIQPTNNPAVGYMGVDIEFVAGTQNMCSIIGATSSQADNATRYWAPMANEQNNITIGTIEANIADIIPMDGTLKNFRVRLDVLAGGSITVTVRRNGAPTPLTLTLNAPITTLEDLVNTQAINAGDLISIETVTVNSGPPRTTWNVEFYP